MVSVAGLSLARESEVDDENECLMQPTFSVMFDKSGVTECSFVPNAGVGLVSVCGGRMADCQISVL